MDGYRMRRRVAQRLRRFGLESWSRDGGEGFVTFPRSEIGPCVDGSLGVTACEVYADVRIVARHRASLA